jgi:hypothetical protein
MSWRKLIHCTDDELASIDPVVQNLEVARGIPALSHLHVSDYTDIVDRLGHDFQDRLDGWELEFHKTPWDWDGDIDLFRLGQLCFYIHHHLGIRYKEDEKNVTKVRYTDPSDLFINGVLDTRRGTCGNMAVLQMAIGWRLGWPVSLAMAWWHSILRFDNGKTVWNIETTNTEGGFRAHPDSFYMAQKHLGITPEHVASGSDLTFLKPRQVLGVFIGTRGRHWWDVAEAKRAQEDYELASCLFPQSRLWRQKAGEAKTAAGGWFKEGHGPGLLAADFVNSVTVGIQHFLSVTVSTDVER